MADRRDFDDFKKKIALLEDMRGTIEEVVVEWESYTDAFIEKLLDEVEDLKDENADLETEVERLKASP